MYKYFRKYSIKNQLPKIYTKIIIVDYVIFGGEWMWCVNFDVFHDFLFDLTLFFLFFSRILYLCKIRVFMV